MKASRAESEPVLEAHKCCATDPGGTEASASPSGLLFLYVTDQSQRDSTIPSKQDR